MRRIITIAVIVATATITMAWSVSTAGPGGPRRGTWMMGGGGAMPTHSAMLW